MSHLAEHLERYLTIRRALGFKLVNEERMLNSFVAFAGAAGERTISIDIALRWARQPTHVDRDHRVDRVRVTLCV